MILNFILPIWFKVYFDPYKGIKYGNIDEYSYDQSYKIKVWTPETSIKQPENHHILQFPINPKNFCDNFRFFDEL